VTAYIIVPKAKEMLGSEPPPATEGAEKAETQLK
jgi:hypothetical protein